MSQISKTKKHGVIVFDSDCMICNWTVSHVIKYDKNNIFNLTSFGSDYLRNIGLGNISKASVALIINGEVLIKTEALFKIINELSYPIKIFKIFQIIPSSITDKIYCFIANHRRRISIFPLACSLHINKNRLYL